MAPPVLAPPEGKLRSTLEEMDFPDVTRKTSSVTLAPDRATSREDDTVPPAAVVWSTVAPAPTVHTCVRPSLIEHLHRTVALLTSIEGRTRSRLERVKFCCGSQTLFVEIGLATVMVVVGDEIAEVILLASTV
jgi:hypothetical protein